MSGTTQAEKNRKPIRCLVIQLARLGDTIQSLMALRAAKQLYPELEIHFLARERFSAAARRVPWVEKVITLDSDELLGPVLDGRKTQSEALRELARWVGPLVREPWDFVINWSYSEASSFLTGLLPADVKLGYSRRKDTTFSAIDGWSHYIQAVVQGGVEQNIHLTDVLTTQLLTALQIHAGDPADNGDLPVTSKTFFAINNELQESSFPFGDYSRKWIGVQLGASQEEKTWPSSKWSALLGRILERHPEYRVVLLGGKEDRERARSIQGDFQQQELPSARLVSLVGETDFDLWASVVGRCNWVFSGDTAALHLASVLGTRVFNISVGPVRWAETGPYGNGHYVISAAKGCEGCASREKKVAHSCRDAISPEAAYAAWTYAASDTIHRRETPLLAHFEKVGAAGDARAIQVFRSKIRGTQDGGGVHYEPLLEQALDVADWKSMVMGHVARAWYCGWTPTIGQELVRECISPALIQELRTLEESCLVLSKICEEATKTAVQLNLKSSRLRSDRIMRVQDRQELQELGSKLNEMDQLIERMGKTHSVMLPFAQMAKVLMHNLSGSQLAELGKESAESYKQLFEGVAILRQWIQRTLELARPVALQSNVVSLAGRIKVQGPGKDLTT